MEGKGEGVKESDQNATTRNAASQGSETQSVAVNSADFL